ncbi:uncharacterized protein (DUF1800 family) [Tumebacillus sp. BK434]|uniref:DUF1800 domain-containing protein n=1 Tax=Tumebacillus sp. BK434 TaxID=2512169 RepID=UPI0010D6D6CB|nr:DUF1800 domain-containing protein [Tumebacillus sp. BK434]TCP55370.1 uncharacterized protein (DUF1800 family) [Tumebacillus sp. BK434]
MRLATEEAKIAHLLRRTGYAFQTPPVKSGQVAAVVESILNTTLEAPKPPMSMVWERTEMQELTLWWLLQMMKSKHPLQERMTLFWHGHFTSGIQKVKRPDFMARQNVLLRRHALGNFRKMICDVAIDPAMMIWLDNNANIKAAPNENFSRELMELFTLGVGNYTESDVQEAARALTGWRLNRKDPIGPQTVTFSPINHDDGRKTILGQTGSFDLQGTVDLLIKQPATARLLAAKLWEFFAYPSPEPSVLQPVIDAFVISGYEIKALLRALFTSEAFYSDRAYLARVKSPVEYVISILGLFPGLQLQEKHQKLTLQSLHLMGQELFDPPTVAGWPSGAAWLSSSMMFARFNYAEVMAENVPLSGWPSADKLELCLKRAGLEDLSKQTRTQIESYLKQTKATGEKKLRGLLYLLFISPEAQTL